MAESTTDSKSNPTSWCQFEKVFSQRNVANNAGHVIPYIKPDSRIIDVGCGTGSITLDFAQRVPQGFVLGIDHSEASINRAKSLAEEMGLKNISFQVVDVDKEQELSHLEVESFDIAHLHQVLLHLPRPVHTLKSIRPLLNPHHGILAARDNAFLHFHPSGPTMLEDIRRFGAASPGASIGGGRINHVWMHDAGFGWEGIEMGCEAINSTDRMWKEGAMRGYVDVAVQRGEGEEFLRSLREEWEEYVESEEGRAIALDSWCVGRMGG